jgi:acyl-CoA thioesterase
MLRCMTQLSADLTTFDRTTTLVAGPYEPGRFGVVLDDGWSSLVGIHGGYLSALTVKGAEAVAGIDRPVRTVTTSFLRTGRPGPAEVVVRTIRAGRTVSTVTADVVQESKILVTSRLTLLTERTGVEWTAPQPIDVLPLDECVDFSTDVGHFDQAIGRLDPRRMPFSDGPQARVSGYIRPLEPRVIDPAWLAMASDWFPPPAFVRLAPPTGGVSIDLTTHVHRPGLHLADDEWLVADFAIDDSTGGLAVEHGRITLPDGTIVAESLQTRLTA